MRPLYFALSSDTRQLANAALLLLGAVARVGPGVARDLATAFDWSLSALPALSRPPTRYLEVVVVVVLLLWEHTYVHLVSRPFPGTRRFCSAAIGAHSQACMNAHAHTHTLTHTFT